MADSPGGVEEGRVSVKVVPDTSRFPADLKADLERIRAELSVKIPVELDTSGIIENAKAATEEAQAAAGKVHIKVDVDKNALGQAQRLLSKFGSSVASGLTTVLRGASFAALGLTAAAAVPHILTLASSLFSVVGVIGLIPAAAGGAVASVAALGLGFQGFGTALKDIGDPAKFAQDLKSLAPAARGVAKEIKALTPQFRDLQQTVQQHLFAGLAADVRTTVSAVLPSLKTGLAGIADGFNLIFHNSGIALSNLARTGQLTTLFGNLKTSLQLIAPAIADMLDAFGRIAAIGSSFLPGLAGGIQEAATAFRDFIDTPKGAADVKSFIQGALDAFGQLAKVAVAAASAIGGVIRAAQAAGGGTLATFATLLQGVADVVNGPAFQTGLIQVFTGLDVGASALASALPAIGNALVALAPAIADFAAGIGTVLAAALKAIAPAIVTLAPALDQLIQVLVNGLVAGIQLLAPLLAQLASVLASNKPLLVGIAIAFAAINAPMLLVIAAVALVALHFQDLVTFFQGNVLPVLVTIQTALQPVIDAFIQLGGQVVSSIAAMIPIVMQIVAVFVTQWPAIRATVSSVMTSVRDIIVAALQIITVLFKVATAVIVFLWNTFGGTILGVIQRVFPAILQIIRGVFNVVAGVFQAVSALLRGDWSGLWDAIKRITSGGIDIVLGLIKGIAGLIRGAFGLIVDAAEALGKAIINGIVSGVKAVGGAVKDAVVGVAKGAFDGAKSFLHINSPSKLFRDEIGAPISEGIAAGVTRGAPAVDAAVQQAILPGELQSGAGFAVTGGSTGARAAVNIENLTVADVEEMAKAIASEQRDAATIENLQAALVGG